MRRSLPIGFGLLILLSAPSVRAQCFDVPEFGSVGGMMTPQDLRIATGGSLSAGDEIGRFWDAANSALGNNFIGSCPSNDSTDPLGPWWQVAGDGQRGIRGRIDGSACAANSCPDELTILVEDRGTFDDAWFIAMRVPNGAAGSSPSRDWDLAIVDDAVNGTGDSVVPMVEIPSPVPVSSSGGQLGLIEVELVLPDVAAGVWSVDALGQPRPASSVVAGYDVLMVTNALQDPGRDRASWGVPAAQVPYLDAAAQLTLDVPCPSVGGDTYLALGLRFFGGDGPLVDGALVSRAVQITCGLGIPGEPAGDIASLALARLGDGGHRLQWTPSCLGNDLTYAVYEGALGDFEGHLPLTCGTSGATSFDVSSTDGSAYYVVVAVSGGTGGPISPREGSYGRTSAGAERPASVFACTTQDVGSCP